LWNDLCTDAPDAKIDAVSAPLSAALLDRFRSNVEMRAVDQVLTNGARLFQEVAAEVFPGILADLAGKALHGVVSVGMMSKAADSGVIAPTIPI
jgi:hypothetical protein